MYADLTTTTKCRAVVSMMMMLVNLKMSVKPVSEENLKGGHQSGFVKHHLVTDH